MPPRGGNASVEDWLLCVYWTAFFPFALYHHQSKKRAKQQFIEELENRSDKLCWACTAYFIVSDRDKPRATWPVHKTEEEWKLKNSFGWTKTIKERSERCVSCKFIAELYGESFDNWMHVKQSDWGFWVGPREWEYERQPRSMKPLYRANLAETSSTTVAPDDIHIVNSSIDWNVARSWLRNCSDTHGTSCKSGWNLLWETLPDMRIVDVEDMTILWPLPENCKYAVLSYTWGNVRKTKIANPTRKRIDLRPYHRYFPKTIKHAITATKNMGLKYLWVDSLCIQSRVEGDEATRNADEGMQFSSMHMIYGMASICIVAAQGSSANDGLWGIGREPKDDGYIQHPQPNPHRSEFSGQSRVDITKDMTLVTSMPLPSNISECAWASRAWCLQEQLFSNRYLIFFDNQVYFQCKNGMWFEDMPLHLKYETIIQNLKMHQRRENETSKNSAPHTKPRSPVLGRIEEINIDVSKLAMSDSKSQYVCVERVGKTRTVVRSRIFKEYQSIVALYSQRKMTFPTDALKAVDGLLSVVKAGMHTTMLFGLPESMLDVALLWRGSKPLVARGRGTENPSDSLPSWSWAGWTGPVQYEPLMEFRAKGREFVEIKPSAQKRPFYPENIRPFICWFKPRRYSDKVSELKEKAGALDLVNGTGFGVKTEGNERPEDWSHALKTPGYKETYTDPSLDVEWSPTHLYTWTMCTNDFTIDTGSNSSYETNSTLQQRYITHGTKIVGELWLDEIGPRWSGGISCGGGHLVVVSEARYFRNPELNEDNEVYNWPNDFLLYNVLLVRFVGGVAFRMGIGKVSKIEWGLMSPKFEFVRLG